SYSRATALGFAGGLAYHRLAQTLAKLGRRDESLKDYDQALMRYPLLERAVRAQVLTEKGLLLFKAQRLAEVVASQTEAQKTYPEGCRPRFEVGEALAKLGRLEESAGEYEAARQVSPRLDVVYWNLGVILEELHRDREALRLWEDYVDLSKDSAHLADAR